MAWGKGGKGKKGQKQQKQQKPREEEEQPQYLKAVDPKWNLNKAALRGYASVTGSPFYAAQGQSDSDFLGLANVLEKQKPYTTEIANRLGIALSEAGGTLAMGKELLDKYAADPAETGTKLGVQGVMDLLQAPEGQAFLQAAKTFNKHSEEPKNTAALQNAAGKWVDFLLENPKEKAKAAQRLVKSSARAYLLGMELLQWFAVGKNPAEWANKLKLNKSLQPEKVQKWIRQPSDKSRLIAALVAAYEDQIDTQPKRGGQALSDSEESSAKPKSAGGGGGNSSSQQSGADSSSSSDKKAKKSKKSKKDKKAAKDKKKSKKDKKDKSKKKKKASKKSSSSGSSKKPSAAASSSESLSASARRKRKAAPAEKPKEKKSKGAGGKPTVKVHRVTGAVDGKMLAKKSDCYDKIEITEDSTTVADVQLKVLTALGGEQDAANWNCMQLLESGKIVAVAPELRAVELVGGLVMVAKGG